MKYTMAIGGAITLINLVYVQDDFTNANGVISGSRMIIVILVLLK